MIKRLPKKIGNVFTREPRLNASTMRMGATSTVDGFDDPLQRVSLNARIAQSVELDAPGKGMHTSMTVVEGIALPINRRADRDPAAIPTAADSALVMTESTTRNVRELAVHWRVGHPVLLEGATGSGKSAAIRYLAMRTQTPYRQVSLSQGTDESDLIGRYVAGEVVYNRELLAKMGANDLRDVGAKYGCVVDGVSEDALIAAILVQQNRPRWVDGPIVRAMKNGEVLVLDELNLAQYAVVERLNSLFDDDRNVVLTEHANEIIAPDPAFRLFATLTQTSRHGREQLSDAMRSRWSTVTCAQMSKEDVRKIVTAAYNEQIPQEQLDQLVEIHHAIATTPTPSTSRPYTLRDVVKVANRYVRFNNAKLNGARLLRRELEEVYGAGLPTHEARRPLEDALGLYLNVPTMAQETVTIDGTDPDNVVIGDVSTVKLNSKHPLVPDHTSHLEPTKRTARVLYLLAKALEMGENVALVGERATGKTAIAKMYASLRGQPYYRQLFSQATDTMQIIGGFADQGWNDGLLLAASRPENAPGLFLADEFNMANGAMLERLNSVLGEERCLVLAEKASEHVPLHKDFRFVAAMNPTGRNYSGRQELSPTLRCRFTEIFVPDATDGAELRAIVTAMLQDPSPDRRIAFAKRMAKRLVDMHERIVRGYKDGTLGKGQRVAERPVLSLRQLSKCVEIIHSFPGTEEDKALHMAIECEYAAKAQEADRKTIMGWL